MSRLVTIKISAAAASQRRGRAGRLGPGRCYRLWSTASERAMVRFDAPEIEDGDLAPLALELAVWGAKDPGALAFLTPPPAAAFAQARDLLARLHAIDDIGSATAHGRAMAELGVHPRIAHMMLCAKVRRMGGLACDIAAILSERDMMRGRHSDCDLQHRLTILNGARPGGAECDPDQVSRIRRASLDWRRQLGEGKTHPRNVEAAGRLRRHSIAWRSGAPPDSSACQWSVPHRCHRSYRSRLRHRLARVYAPPGCLAADLGRDRGGFRLRHP
jgi:ATP-dependent helicase HrpB